MKKSYLIFFSAIVGLLASFAVVAEDEVNNKFSEDNEKLLQLTTLANNGNARAQYQLGNMFDNGMTSAADVKTAVYWFIKSAKNGYAPAQHSLATHYMTGRGINANTSRSVYWLELAAAQSEQPAMRDLGYLYYQGKGVKKNYAKAQSLLLAPANKGDELAANLLGEIYYTGGFGVTKNRQMAINWFQLAAKAGSKTAESRLNEIQPQTYSRKKTLEAVKKVPAEPAVVKAIPAEPAVVKAIPAEPVVVKTIPADTETDTSARSSSPPLVADGFADSARRFKELDGENYILQLIAASKTSTIKKLIGQYQDEHTFYFQISKKGSAMYVLIYGDYPDRATAAKAIKKLPQAFRINEPWIRQVKDVIAYQH